MPKQYKTKRKHTRNKDFMDVANMMFSAENRHELTQASRELMSTHMPEKTNIHLRAIKTTP